MGVTFITSNLTFALATIAQNYSEKTQVLSQIS